MKRSSTWYLAFAILFFTGCTARACQSCERDMQFSARDYEVIMYSGGDTVYYDKFHGIINDDKGETGLYYFKGDSMYELHGDYIIKSIK